MEGKNGSSGCIQTSGAQSDANFLVSSLISALVPPTITSSMKNMDDPIIRVKERLEVSVQIINSMTNHMKNNATQLDKNKAYLVYSIKNGKLITRAHI